MKMKNTDEFLRKAQLVLEIEHLEIFESVKEVVRRRMNFIWRSVEREKIQAPNLASPFQTVMMKNGSSRASTRVVSDHVHQH